MKLKKIVTVISLSLVLFANIANAESIGDVSTLRGVRDNKLQGFGLVVGLPNSGDRGNFASSNLKTLIQKYGIKVPTSVRLSSKNIAAVVINATLPPFAKIGQTIDVTVSTIGNAKSLRGGTLVATALLGQNKLVYGMGQGQILVDGVSAEGMDGSTLDINTSSVGRIPSGGTIERELSYGDVFSGKTITINLNKSSFSLASTIQQTINKKFGIGTATAMDAGSVQVVAPSETSKRIAFISKINDLDLSIPKPKAKVSVNSRTGTVMITGDVTLSPVAISEAGVIINISEQQGVSQPTPISGGQTVETKSSQVSIKKQQDNLKYVTKSASLKELVSTLNSISTSPKDLASIIQLLKSSGSLNAEVEVI
ncbi:flagellar basal body P-ring protein FlgI [Photobacterium kishitanii]|uniref:Flagellar P-ring protein n=1 Tax=Photobacterium kishitanii TaxID=318456 RepID=A0A2T3KMT9_9GAMM|nr:flagellar basal body P-ring protein FlgI [Photobacterium kishitanii]PSV01116.1 flagellar biosynthesis protein FlgI [Photobacterium kishitanii]